MLQLPSSTAGSIISRGGVGRRIVDADTDRVTKIKMYLLV